MMCDFQLVIRIFKFYWAMFFILKKQVIHDIHTITHVVANFSFILMDDPIARK